MRLDPIAAGLGDLSDEIGYALGAKSELWKRKQRKGTSAGLDIPDWKWRHMHGVADYLRENGLTGTRKLREVFGVRAQLWLKTMTFYWPIYEEEGTDQNYIGILTDPIVEAIFQEMRDKLIESYRRRDEESK